MTDERWLELDGRRIRCAVSGRGEPALHCVHGLADALEIWDRVVALTLALARPERVAGLVLLGTASQCSARVAEWYEKIAAAGEAEGLPGLSRAIYRDPERLQRGDGRAMAEVTRALVSLFADPLTPKLAALHCPVLLLVGSKDPMGPRASELIRDALPEGRGRLVVLPERGHWLHVEAPDDVLVELDRWRRDAEGRS
jgi:pimeloyl-ACP methyl ester carboxylesterase